MSKHVFQEREVVPKTIKEVQGYVVASKVLFAASDHWVDVGAEEKTTRGRRTTGKKSSLWGEETHRSYNFHLGWPCPRSFSDIFLALREQ